MVSMFHFFMTLKFDVEEKARISGFQCATQYDYDKLTVHAGSTVSAKKVGELCCTGDSSISFRPWANAEMCLCSKDKRW